MHWWHVAVLIATGGNSMRYSHCCDAYWLYLAALKQSKWWRCLQDLVDESLPGNVMRLYGSVRFCNDVKDLILSYIHVFF
jgi:hypothetical protein